ncbi:uncharacterized aarF domain-containing protein kinase 2-like isoform X2 [Diachasmimorpha longicaudata]|uniref:uncharacterized aarF domain-containing protein kinase 2-like isoform X2 n=1 Tax=Diachasmimorpha longicaudata TaxID=58733 RepID=UPI0030B86CF3
MDEFMKKITVIMPRYLKLSKIVRSFDYSRYFIRGSKSSSKQSLSPMSIARMRASEVFEVVPKPVSLTGQWMKEKIVRQIRRSENGRLTWSFWLIVLALIRVTLITWVALLLLILYCSSPKAYSAVLVQVMEFLGSTFIKLGQWASTRRDLFSEDFCDTLAHLQRKSSNHSWMYTEFLMSATFGPQWEKLFRRIDREPIGSGCCAQVHKAWVDQNKLKLYKANDDFHTPVYLHVLEHLRIGFILDFISSGYSRRRVISEKSKDNELMPVVVKVMHPGVENYIVTDLFMIEFLSILTSLLVPSLRWLDLPGCVREFSIMMLNQLDMKIEARNLHRFLSNFSRTHTVIFPTPLKNLTTRKILVESYHEGNHISEYFKLSDHDDLKKQVFNIVIPLVIKMVFKDNFFHCDLHPGNILVQEEDIPRCRKNKTQLYQRIFSFYGNKSPRIVILDCGLVSSLNDRCLQNLRHVFHAIITGKVNLIAVMKEFYTALIDYKVQQDSAFVNVMLTVLLIENLGRNLDPTNDVLQELITFLH